MTPLQAYAAAIARVVQLERAQAAAVTARDDEWVARVAADLADARAACAAARQAVQPIAR